MPNPAGNLIVGSDGEMDERVARLKRRLGVADRPVESRVDPGIVDGEPLADRLFARLERAGTRLFTSELAHGLHVREGVERVEDALRGLVADGRVECVVSWKVRR